MHNIFIIGVSEDTANINKIKDLIERSFDDINCSISSSFMAWDYSGTYLDFVEKAKEFDVLIFVASHASRLSQGILSTLTLFNYSKVPMYSVVVDDLDFQSTERSKMFSCYSSIDDEDALLHFIQYNLKDNKDFDIFISYSRKDYDDVKLLKDSIEEYIPGVKFWFDIDGIKIGDEFPQKIVSAIEKSKMLLFAASENSMNGQWTQKEVCYAKNIGLKIVPVLLHNVKLSGWFLFEFGNIDCVSVDNRLQFNKMLDNLSGLLGKPLKSEDLASIH